MGRVPMRMTLTARRADRSMRKLCLAVPVPRWSRRTPDEFVTDVDDAMDENLRSASR